jgi:hypothetical protein
MSRRQQQQVQQQLNQTMGAPLILFNGSKKELNTPTQGFKLMHRKLRASYRIDLYVFA